MELGDETQKIFINADGKRDGLSDDMKAFLDYLKGKLTEHNQFITGIQREIETAKSREEWRVEYMTLMMEYRERFKEGFIDG